MRLEEISDDHFAAFLVAVEDYRKNDPSALKRLFGHSGEWTATSFKKFVKTSQKEKMDWRPGAKGVSLSRYVMLGDDGQLRAFGLLRFPLDEVTENDGGNLVCDVPPSLRKRGFGSYCLALLLFEAVRAGLRRALVTAPEKDLAARKIIERNRGVLDDVVDSRQAHHKGQRIARYWISFT